MTTVYLRVSQWGYRPSHEEQNSLPPEALVRHFYGTVRDTAGKVLLEVMRCATRRRVIETAKRDLPSQYPGHRFKMIVRRGTELF